MTWSNKPPLARTQKLCRDAAAWIAQVRADAGKTMRAEPQLWWTPAPCCGRLVATIAGRVPPFWRCPFCPPLRTGWRPFEPPAGDPPKRAGEEFEGCY